MARRKRKSNPVYQTKAWKQARKKHLAKHPDCEICLRRGKYRRHVHHIYGVRQDKFHRHLKTLCSTCHAVLEKIALRRGNLTLKMVTELWRLARIKWR